MQLPNHLRHKITLGSKFYSVEDISSVIQLHLKYFLDLLHFKYFLDPSVLILSSLLSRLLRVLHAE